METGFLLSGIRTLLEDKMRNMGSVGSSGRLSVEDNDEAEISRLAMSSLQAREEEMASLQIREEEIERKKMAVREKVELQLGRAEQESRRLTQIWEELEELADPMRKEVSTVRKRIDMANRDLKPLGHLCQKKEKEYKEALEAFNQKNKEKAQLVTALIELLTESERLRLMRLDELSKNIESRK